MKKNIRKFLKKCMKKFSVFLLLFLIITIILMGVLIVFAYIKSSENDQNKISEPSSTFGSDKKDYLINEGDFELPLKYSTGYASLKMDIKSQMNDSSDTIASLKAGEGFLILEESGDWFKIKSNDNVGYVKHIYCFVNLPDIIPSIIYNITNSYSSKMKSSGKKIDNITHMQLYNVKYYNERLTEEEYAVPVLYAFAKKIAKVQKDAIKNNETLIIYEAFRPYNVQRSIVKNLTLLAEKDSEVKEGITSGYWTTAWFINTGLSNHQKGLAIDASLGKILKRQTKYSGNYKYEDIVDYQEYRMPSEIHELSVVSSRFTYPVESHSKTAWKNAKYTSSMNEPAYTLEKYCTDAGLTPLASEWWHFNDLDCLENQTGSGMFYIKKIYSEQIYNKKNTIN